MKHAILITAYKNFDHLYQLVNFLKIDIEGAEYILLKHIASRLFYVKNLFVEYHSDKNKKQELGELLSIITNARFRYYLKEATALATSPFVNNIYGPYDIQLNIFCYRENNIST